MSVSPVKGSYRAMLMGQLCGTSLMMKAQGNPRYDSPTGAVFSHMKSRKCWDLRLRHCTKLFFSPMEMVIFRRILTIGKILLCHEEQESHRMN